MIYYFVLPAMLGIYALVAAFFFHWANAYVLAGISFGCANATLSIRWYRPSKWFHYGPYAVVLGSVLLAIIIQNHTKVAKGCLVFVVATLGFYVFQIFQEKAAQRRARRQAFLEVDIVRVLAAVPVGQLLQLVYAREDGDLLSRTLDHLQASGWEVERFRAASLSHPAVQMWYFILVAPQTEAELEASFEALKFKDTE
jgi:hypothetical protein